MAIRLQIMCDVEISEKRKPQDGKIKFKKYELSDIAARCHYALCGRGRRYGDANFGGG